MNIKIEANKQVFFFADDTWATIHYLPSYHQWYGYYCGRRFANGDIISVYCAMLIYCYNSINFVPQQKEEFDDDF